MKKGVKHHRRKHHAQRRAMKRNPAFGMESGAVIRVTDRGKVWFFTRDNILASSVVDAKRFRTAADAIPTATALSKVVPKGMEVRIVG